MRKNQLIGSTLFISGVILFGIIHLAVASYIPHMGVYENPPGRLFTVLGSITAWVPYILSIIMMIGGFILLLLPTFKQTERS
ncbi:MAG: hypothetical protein ACQEV0_01635 [Bacillota bacterium]